MNYLIATALAFVAALIFNYVLSVQWVFKMGSASPSVFSGFFSTFAVISLGGLLLHSGLVFAFVEKFRVYPILSNTISSGIVMVYSFIARKILLFKNYNE